MKGGIITRLSSPPVAIKSSAKRAIGLLIQSLCPLRTLKKIISIPRRMNDYNFMRT